MLSRAYVRQKLRSLRHRRPSLLSCRYSTFQSFYMRCSKSLLVCPSLRAVSLLASTSRFSCRAVPQVKKIHLRPPLGRLNSTSEFDLCCTLTRSFPTRTGRQSTVQVRLHRLSSPSGQGTQWIDLRCCTWQPFKQMNTPRLQPKLLSYSTQSASMHWPKPLPRGTSSQRTQVNRNPLKHCCKVNATFTSAETVVSLTLIQLILHADRNRCEL